MTVFHKPILMVLLIYLEWCSELILFGRVIEKELLANLVYRIILETFQESILVVHSNADSFLRCEIRMKTFHCNGMFLFKLLT